MMNPKFQQLIIGLFILLGLGSIIILLCFQNCISLSYYKENIKVNEDIVKSLDKIEVEFTIDDKTLKKLYEN